MCGIIQRVSGILENVQYKDTLHGGLAASHRTALQAVLASTTSGSIPEGTQAIRGWEFDDGNDLDGIMGAMLHTGIQATALGRAMNEINRMVGPLILMP